MVEGFVHTNRSGNAFRVVKYVWNREVYIEAVDTVTYLCVRADILRQGTFKDRRAPSVLGVGFIGYGNHVAHKKGKATKKYTTWQNMFERCYCPKYQEKQPTYIGCSVAKEWHDFQVFGEWYEEHYIEGYHLDKDIIEEGNRVYSPDYCKFVTQADNNEKAWAKIHKLISPLKEIVEVYNLAKYCRENQLNDKAMYAVSCGDREEYKGWRKL